MKKKVSFLKPKIKKKNIQKKGNLTQVFYAKKL